MTLYIDRVPILGEAARGWLSQGRSGKVFASVTHATYLLTEAGELVWLATPESPKHRRCILWPRSLPTLKVESSFTIRDGSICLESGAKLDLRISEVWDTPFLKVSEVIEFEILPDKLTAIVSNLMDWKTTVGFGLFIPSILQIARKQDVSTGFQSDNFLLATSWSIVEKITRACLSHDLPVVLKQADALIGLGEGLTPSGDDFLGGLFFACFLLSYSYPSIHFSGSDDLPGWVDAHSSCTNQISFALLRDNASGHTLEPLNRFGIALLTDQPVEAVTSAASDLIKVGHSTGWSMLTGFLVGMLLAFPEEICISRS